MGDARPQPISPRQPHLPQHLGLQASGFLLCLALPTSLAHKAPARPSDPSFRSPSPGSGAPSRVFAWPTRLPSPGQGSFAQPSQARGTLRKVLQGEVVGAVPGEWGGSQQLQPCPHPLPRAPQAPVTHLPPTCSLAGSELCSHPPHQLPLHDSDNQPLAVPRLQTPPPQPGPGPCIAQPVRGAFSCASREGLPSACCHLQNQP